MKDLVSASEVTSYVTKTNFIFSKTEYCICNII